MSKDNRGAVDSGVFVTALVLLVVSILKEWPVLPWISGAVLVGVLVTTVARGRTDGRASEAEERPWRKRAD
ncbi:hypothetical protein ACIBJF_30960 [Streptomyces sp. NPDC050743]|uniref:hypothetical protein n=1 Tax=Streptomyces sp. NPDC050743 TaxID=3365634 RepID=UPI0037B34D8B